MNDACTRITLDIQEIQMPVVVKAKKNDIGRKLLISIADGGLPYTISEDCFATFTAKKADGTKIHNPCTIENNVILYEFTPQTCSAVGTMKAEIKIYGADDKMITSSCFQIIVYDTVYTDGDEVSSEDEMNTLDSLILEARKIINEGCMSDGKSPFIGENGNWFVWDAEDGDYADTGISARVTLHPASAETAGVIKVGRNLEMDDNGFLSVITADTAEQDNTLPITSAAVNTIVGNISVILDTI